MLFNFSYTKIFHICYYYRLIYAILHYKILHTLLLSWMLDCLATMLFKVISILLLAVVFLVYSDLI